MRRRHAAGLLTLLLAVLLAACSAQSSPGAQQAPTRHPSSPAASSGTTSAPTSSSTPSAVAATAPDPCEGNRHGKLVRVSIRRQHLWMCRGTRVVHQSPITSGMRGQYTGTPTGHFRIQALDRNETLTLIDGQQYRVKYWIPFDAPLFGFHDASWQTFPFGSRQWRRHGSHGCVHMPTRAIATLYHWASVGTRVSIH